jgi:hypothetical protein
MRFQKAGISSSSNLKEKMKIKKKGKEIKPD